MDNDHLSRKQKKLLMSIANKSDTMEDSNLNSELLQMNQTSPGLVKYKVANKNYKINEESHGKIS